MEGAGAQHGLDLVGGEGLHDHPLGGVQLLLVAQLTVQGGEGVDPVVADPVAGVVPGQRDQASGLVAGLLAQLPGGALDGRLARVDAARRHLPVGVAVGVAQLAHHDQATVGADGHDAHRVPDLDHVVLLELPVPQPQHVPPQPHPGAVVDPLGGVELEGLEGGRRPGDLGVLRGAAARGAVVGQGAGLAGLSPSRARATARASRRCRRGAGRPRPGRGWRRRRGCPRGRSPRGPCRRPPRWSPRPGAGT